MGADLRLILFDVDGTLVDSQASILAVIAVAFRTIRHAAPDRETVLGIVGLFLDRAVDHLVPDLDRDAKAAWVAAYKTAYFEARTKANSAEYTPLYLGARAMLDALKARDHLLLGVATGKSKRGLDAVLAAHGLERYFVTLQVADHHPSKPHPSMVLAAMAETEVGPDATVMIGDTRFDMNMARAARIPAIGVSWGYHPAASLGADHVIEAFEDLPAVLDTLWDTGR
ncbi:MAG: HAD-IA family hydrolase [Rhodobacteraceae bacterium]|nr:HAD-IA family hydrolase [Paracoccaceae bacterium]